MTVAFTIGSFAIAATFAVAVPGCDKRDFEDECEKEHIRKDGVTLRGRLLVPSQFSWRCRGDSYICPLPLTASEPGAKPYIHVYVRAGDSVGTVQPLHDKYNLVRDFRMHAQEGRKARLGQRIEITGDLLTYYGCELRNVQSVRVLDPPGPRPEQSELSR